VYTVEEGQICYNSKPLAPANKVIIDVHQDLAAVADKKIVVQRLPEGDYCMVGVGGHIILLEEKKQADLDTSWRSRRLQRQLRKMQEVNPDGINGLALRLHSTGGQGGVYLMQWNELLLDLAKLQLLSIPIVFLPGHGVVEHLTQLCAVMQPGRHLLSPLAGDDRGKVREKMEPVALALRMALKGVGYKLANVWAEAADQSLPRALSMTEEEMKEIKLPANVRRRVEELR
jgi:hypothetical protein